MILVALVAMAALALSALAYRPPFFFDDAMFFLRYAEHLAQGEGFRWNLGEPPVWGASAPLWPLMVAGLIRCGVGPEASMLTLSWGLGLAGAPVLALAALRCAGVAGAAWCILFQSVNFAYGNSVLSGMESPLAILLVSCGVLALCGRVHWWAVGIVAGLAMVQKIDLAPFGFLLLAGAWIRLGRVPWRAGATAALIAGAWYLFAYLHFGSVIPNSFVTKLHATYGTMARGWFLDVALLEGGRLAATASAALALPALWRRKELLLVCLGLIAVMLAGYTLRPPPENFGWYRSPVQPVLCFLAGVGVGSAMRGLMLGALMTPPLRTAIQAVTLATVGFLIGLQETPQARWVRWYMARSEADRSEAGKWIDAHTPKDARLLTGFGHISYYAHRYTYDYSFLNRPGPTKSIDELIAEHRPEVLGLCIFRTGIPPEKYVPPAGYRIAKVFDRTYRDRVDDYYVAVLVRADLPVLEQ